MRAHLKWIQTMCSCSRTACRLILPETPTVTCRAKSHLIEPAMWPANSPDLNLVDYALWRAVQQRVYLRWLFETGNRVCVVCAVSKFIDRSINEWRRRLKCVVQQNGRHTEHLSEQLFSRRLYMAFLLQLVHICKLYSFIDFFCASSTFSLHASCSMWRHLM